MIDTPASPALPQRATVCLNGIDDTMRSWMMKCQPLVEFSETRSSRVAAACYGDSYHQGLAADYEFNSEFKIPTVLCLSQDCPDTFVHLLQLHVQHVIFHGMPFDAEAFQLAITPRPRRGSAEDTPFFSAAGQDFPSIQRLSVRSAADLHAAISTTGVFFREHECGASQADAAALVVKEALTNSVYHGFRRADSHERKYDPAAFDNLENGDRVDLTLASADDWLIVRVADNAGALGPLRFANSLDRQMSERGLLDSRGRGFYLMRHLSDRMVVTIARGKATALELYFLRIPRRMGSMKKHFELFEL